MDINPAATKAIGTPSNALGTLANSNFSLTPDKSINARKKPNEAPIPLAMASIKVYCSWIFNIVTPSTIQLVVISGR